MKTVITIIGTRPEIIKMSPLIPLFDDKFNHILIHSGQHYSPKMDAIFFEELNLRKPDYTFECGNLNSVEQVAQIMIKLESIVMKVNPDAIVVHGDTNTTLAGALTAAKYKGKGVKLVHVEAGCRSHNLQQAEEINRVIVDRVSDLMFVPTLSDSENLAAEGLPATKYFVTGNTVIDSCLRASAIVDTKTLLNKYHLTNGSYALMTMHRQETVDTEAILTEMIDAIEAIAEKIPVIFPLHPRTEKRMTEFSLSFKNKNIKIIEPVGYLDMIGLTKSARFCITDSGGLQEEASVLKIPTIVIRKETEYTHYVRDGILFLTGPYKDRILDKVDSLISDESSYQKFKSLNISFPTNSSQVILEKMEKLL